VRRLLIVGLGLWCVIALGLKYARYDHPPMAREARSIAAVSTLMASHGWEFGGWEYLTSDRSLRIARFHQPGCPEVMVAVVARPAESMGLVTERLGPTRALIAETPDRLTLAILPAPAAQPAPCAPPVLAEWQALAPAPLDWLERLLAWPQSLF